MLCFVLALLIFLAALGLCGCTRALSSQSGDYFPAAGRGLLIVVASLVAEHRP